MTGVEAEFAKSLGFLSAVEWGQPFEEGVGFKFVVATCCRYGISL